MDDENNKHTEVEPDKNENSDRPIVDPDLISYEQKKQPEGEKENRNK